VEFSTNKGFIKAELQRYAVTNTLPADFLHMKSLFLQRLLDRGYPLHRLNSSFSKLSVALAACSNQQQSRAGVLADMYWLSAHTSVSMPLLS
jgi:hypothetical protein